MSTDDRHARLAAELDVMRELAKQSSVLDFEADGDPPEKYTITFRGRGMKRASSSGDQVEYIDLHRCEIRFGYGFPRQPPEVRWLTPILHPNVSYSGYVGLKDCGLAWQEDLMLDVVCERLWDLARLAWIDLETATNISAKTWFSKHPPVIMPLDPRPLRGGGGPSPSNIVRYQRAPARPAASADDGILYIGENTPTPELPQPRTRPQPPRRRSDDDILYIGDD